MLDSGLHLPTVYVCVCISDYGLDFLKIYREVYLGYFYCGVLALLLLNLQIKDIM